MKQVFSLDKPGLRRWRPGYHLRGMRRVKGRKGWIYEGRERGRDGGTIYRTGEEAEQGGGRQGANEIKGTVARQVMGERGCVGCCGRGKVTGAGRMEADGDAARVECNGE